MELSRCAWVGTNPLLIKYHDTEWGVPVHDDRKLYEFIVLDAFQAGLSWAGVLGKRGGLQRAFADFDPKIVAKFTANDVDRLMQDASIIRNRQKIQASIMNAQAVLRLQESGTSLAELLWGFVGNQTIYNNFQRDDEIPGFTELSIRVSKSLRQHGFSFIGPTICYAFMQGAGLVDDHLAGCAFKGRRAESDAQSYKGEDDNDVGSEGRADRGVSR